MLLATQLGQRPLDALIGEVAGRQHGVIAIAQLLALGLSSAGVRARVRRGALVGIHRGVYAVGHAPLTAEGRWMAAVLACGDGALLSHRTAAAHLGIRASESPWVDVTVPRSGRRPRRGIRLHRSTTLAPGDATVVDGIPCTSPARTLLDLAEVVAPESLARAVDRAETLRLLDLRALDNVMSRNPGRHALRPLRALLSSLAPQSTLTRNDFERRFLALSAEAGLPPPRPNDWLLLEGAWVQADFHWPEHRLVAETDGWETHGTRRAFERDRRRDQLLLRAGYRTVRFTWRQLRDDPAWVAETVRAALPG
ncbi:MAG TPA: type IV toxin-antitoxin system AbiEi family antitoxin domain-containing protein [Solirubrobacterales bacterium]